MQITPAHQARPGRARLDMPKRDEYRSHIYDGFTSSRLGVCLPYGKPYQNSQPERDYTICCANVYEFGG